jgi:hypothetical protein
VSTTATRLPRYSPSWSSGAFATRQLPAVPDVPTAFDSLVRRLGLQGHPELWTCDTRLCAFAKKNRKTLYVPEKFLQELGLDVEDEL